MNNTLEVLAGAVKTADGFRAARVRCGLSQKQMAERIGVTQPEVSCWERGTRTIPDYAWAVVDRLVARKGAVELQEAAELTNHPLIRCDVGMTLDGSEFFDHMDTCGWCIAHTLFTVKQQRRVEC